LTTYTNYWVGRTEDASVNRVFNLREFFDQPVRNPLDQGQKQRPAGQYEPDQHLNDFCGVFGHQ
jgi:hypothetical protein